MHNFLNTHTIWLIIKLDPDILVTNIFTTFNEDRMKTDSVREQAKTCVTDWRTDWRAEWQTGRVVTRMRIIKLNLFSGSGAVPVNWNVIVFSHVLLYLRTLYIVWSLVRRRLTRRLTRFQAMCNVLKYSKHYKTVAVRLRLIFQLFSTVSVKTISVKL